MKSKDVQMWDNLAFDNGENSEPSINDLNFSWCNNKKKPLSSIDLSHESFESTCTKENVTPFLVDSSISIKSLASVINPLQRNNVGSNAPAKGQGNGIVDDRSLDKEIEKIEKEISRLSSRLEDLRLEKAKRNAKVVEKRGRIVAAKFMEPPKQSIRSSNDERKLEESINMSGKLKTPRRGMSLGPAEIMRSGMRRGISLGPSEIYSATKLKNLGGKQELTPIQSSANRRKSCYWKLNEIDELRVTKERGKSMSLSPKSRCKTVNKPQVPKGAVTTIGVKKTVKKEDGVTCLLQPKKFFVKDVEKTGSCKNSIKSGRVVPSRYNQITSGGSSALKELRKRSWGENEEELRKSEKKRVSVVAKAEVVPRIRTSKCTIESPRDSGPAKRLSELVGKKSFFRENDNENVCQALSFEEENTSKEYPKIRVLRSVNESPRDSGEVKRASQLVERKPFFDTEDNEEMPVFSFEEEDFEGNGMEIEDVLCHNLVFG